MTDIVIHRVRDDAGAFGAMLGTSRASIAREARHTLDELPDSLLKEFGIVREEIPYLSSVLVADDDGAPLTRPPAAAKLASGWVAHSFALVALMLAAVVRHEDRGATTCHHGWCIRAVTVASSAELALHPSVNRGQMREANWVRRGTVLAGPADRSRLGREKRRV